MAEKLYRPPAAALDNSSRAVTACTQWSLPIPVIGSEAVKFFGAADHVPYSFVKKLHDFFSKTAKSFVSCTDDNGKPTMESITWLLCGGTAAKTWASKIVAQEEAQKSKEPQSFVYTTDFFKVDESLGLVLGYAIVCNIEGEPYYDLHGDHIPEESMLKAAVDFMENSRTMKEMHAGKGKGAVVFAWPMTEEIAKAFSITTKTTGLLVAVKPDDPAVLEKFRSGEYTGFSIGGRRLINEEA